MQLFIRKGTALKRIPEVTLKDCVSPKVRQVEETGLEPALWYKVLVCEAILVDLDNRLVRWTVGDGLTMKQPPAMPGDPVSFTVPLSDEQIIEYFKTGESLFEEDYCKEFDSNIEELFQTSADIYKDLDLKMFDMAGNKGVFEKVMQLMHVYILPYIRFQAKHYSHVKLVLETTESEYKQLESKIDGKCKEKHKADMLLKTMREKMILRGDFQSQDQNDTFEHTFLQVFLKHVEGDISRMNTNFTLIETDIDKLRDSTVEQDKLMLATLRAQRTTAFFNINTFLTVREQIKQCLKEHENHERNTAKRPLDLRRGNDETDLQTVYQRIVGNINDMITEITSLMNTRLKVSAVREAVTLTLQELDTFGASFGYNQKRGLLATETDVLDMHKKPNSWLTLQEQVSNLLKTDTRFKNNFEEFCSNTLLRCQLVLSECHLFNEFVQTSLKSGNSSSDVFRDSGVLTTEVEKVCADILSHVSYTVWDMGSQLQSEKQSKHESCKFHGRLYICYEEIVLQKLMIHLCKLFEECNKSRCLQMAKWFSAVSLSKLGINADKLTGKQPMNMSTEQTQAAKACTRKGLEMPENASSVAVKHFTLADTVPAVDTLYNRYNSVSDQCPDEILNNLDFEEAPNCFEQLADSMIDKVKPTANGSNYVTSVAKQLTVHKLSGSREALQDCVKQNRKSAEYCVTEKGTRSIENAFEAFSDMRAMIMEVTKSKTLLDMIRQLTYTLKTMGKRLITLRKSSGNGNKDSTSEREISADDLLDAVVVMLKNLDSDQLLKLYSFLKVITQLMPSFMQGGPSAFALITFTGAFEFLIGSMSQTL